MKNIFISLALILCLSPVVFAVKADVNLELRQVEITDTQVIFDIFITNPSKQKIISTQSWLKYDPSVLTWEEIDVWNSAFDFQAPWENNFDEKKWIIKIGRSSTSWWTSEEEILVATIVFNRKTSKSTNISFHNFQIDDSGNVSVRVFSEWFPVNILKTEPKSFYINWNIEKKVKVIKKEILNRPQWLKVATWGDYAVLAWKSVKWAKWYNLYYSSKSWKYLQRRSVGDVLEYYFEDLEQGKIKFFAITAYDYNHKESDFSNEVRVRIGEQNSSTAPLLLWSQNNKTLSQVKQHVESWPAEVIFWMIFISWIISLFYLAKRR